MHMPLTGSASDTLSTRNRAGASTTPRRNSTRQVHCALLCVSLLSLIQNDAAAWKKCNLAGPSIIHRRLIQSNLPHFLVTSSHCDCIAVWLKYLHYSVEYSIAAMACSSTAAFSGLESHLRGISQGLDPILFRLPGSLKKPVYLMFIRIYGKEPYASACRHWTTCWLTNASRCR